jgi:hypothetical protein
MHPSFSSDINRISQNSDSTKRHDYVLNLFDKMEDVDVDLEDYYDQVTDADAPAASLTESSIATDVHVCPEITVPRTYTQAVDPINEFHMQWRFAAEKELRSLT